MKKEILIEADQVHFTYPATNPDEPGFEAISGIDLVISKGEFVSVIGRNGSGKSTLAKLFNALYLPTKGRVIVNGMESKNPASLWDIRSTVGLVFQNPDTQIIGTTVEEDVAFGPENRGEPPEKTCALVREALEAVGLSHKASGSAHLLSGGQKQKVALAGVLAMRPACIVLDEATSMLEPTEREEMMNILKKLNREEGITVIQITHFMNEAAQSERVLVLEEGRVIYDGTPAHVFSRVEELRALGLDVPEITELFYEINRGGHGLSLESSFRLQEAVESLTLSIIKNRPSTG